ncbi:MAG TPA: ATP-binding protein [Mucilaginibacter sp.]|jgi:signal transduction histidine kinase/CheY-like chemotaxis protein|nr:ATP-binding protein [Mucilaginibacter sp.]
MIEHFSFFNFSLKKVLDREPGSFEKAKIKIVTTILVFSAIKGLIVFFVAIVHQQPAQLLRSGIATLLFLSLLKILLYRPSTIRIVSHAILVLTLVVIYTNLFVLSRGVNIINVQLIFMTILGGYYLIGGRMAFVYVALSTVPALVYMFSQQIVVSPEQSNAEGLPPLGTAVMVTLNFLTFVISQYLYYAAFHENLKEKEDLNKQLQVNVIEAKALAESRSIFLSTMSHELRTPLNGVIGMTNLLKESAHDGQKDYLDILEFSAANLLAMVNDVLDYNKSELDKIELEELPVNLSALLQKISSGLQMKAVEKNLSWKLEIDEVLKNRLVVADPMRLTQIIYNLAGNAIKFTESGRVAISVKALNQNEHRIDTKFIVSDTGIGINYDRQEAVFELFTQESSDTTRKYGGTGLGLAIVKRLLKLLGSNIQLESTPGKGSVFSFVISFAVFDGELTPHKDEAEKTSMKGLKLLIAEDNGVNALILEKILTKWDIQTVVAINGQEALTKMVNERFDGILMDIHMPVMDGYATSKAIRALGDPTKANIPIIALTASVSHNIFTKIKNAGMQDYLTKPFQTDTLHEKIQQLYKTAAV